MTIKEVSRICNLSQDTLRYYEKVGLILNIERTSGGIRNYNEKDVRWIMFITKMKSSGISIEALARYVKLSFEGEHTSAERKNILIEQKSKLEDKINGLNGCLEIINTKIERYDEVLNVTTSVINSKIEDN